MPSFIRTPQQRPSAKCRAQMQGSKSTAPVRKRFKASLASESFSPEGPSTARPFNGADDLRQVKGVSQRDRPSFITLWLMHGSWNMTAQSEIGTHYTPSRQARAGRVPRTRSHRSRVAGAELHRCAGFRTSDRPIRKLPGILRSSGCEIAMLPKADGVGIDSIHVRDASVVCDRGIILCNMSKSMQVTFGIKLIWRLSSIRSC